MISLDKVTKRYRGSKVAAVDAVSLTVKSGEVYGFLGSNGAGKSTTIRTLMGFISPSQGTAKVLGTDVTISAAVAVRKDIGYLAGDVILPKRVTGRALLKHLAHLSGGVDEAYLNELIARFDAQVDKKTETLSKGNRQKIGLLQAFMHQPKVLILDEPTSGLDPLMQEQFYKTVEEARERGAAVFLSSHSFSEVERICDRIGIIRDGKMVHQGPIAKFMADRKPSWRVTLKKKVDVETLLHSPMLTVVEHDGMTLVVEPVKSIASGLAALSKVSIVTMSMGQKELEDEFMSFYGTHEEAQS